MQPMTKTSSSQAPSRTQTVFIVEDHPSFREGLVQILNQEQDLTVCGEAGDATEALRAIARLRPDLMLVDISLPGKSGLELIKEVRVTDQKIKLLVVSMHDEALYAARVLRAGGDGYIMKQEDPQEIIHAVRDVLDGHIYVSEEVMGSTPKASINEPAKAQTRPLDQLTDEELEILEALGQGNSNQEITRQRRAPAGEVAAQCAKMKRKLNLKTTNALIRFAVCWVGTEVA